MGFFSFKTMDTNRSISNIYSKRGTFPVYMTDNKGNCYVEREYEGYGIFGGKDYFELLAEMNGKKGRNAGIDIAFSGQPYLAPNLTETPDWIWVNKIPADCPNQGYFY